MKIRIIKSYKNYTKDQVIEVSPNEAHGLIELGVARVDKMMTPETPGFKVGKQWPR